MLTFEEEFSALREVVTGFVQERLQAKLDKLRPDDESKRAELMEAYQPANWLADAARRVAQIQLVSHTLKAIHPDARGTSLLADSKIPDGLGLIGTHSLPPHRDYDVVGNAAALDVYKFLSIEYGGRSLLQRAIDDDAVFVNALSADKEEAQAWRTAFANLATNKGGLASHTLAKQLYFPLPDSSYHLLAPLFPTTLVHHVHQTIREDRFGDAAKAAREARRADKDWPVGYREYPDLVIRKLGGTKPQNISQLNSERYGENWLLSSEPPLWRLQGTKPPLKVESIFSGPFGRRKSVREAVDRLREFLAVTDHNNLSIRRTRATMVADICDEVHQYAAILRELPASWTKEPTCKLHESEQLWLDPLRVLDDEEFSKRRLWGDWPIEVGKRFANWLNSAIESDKVKLGEDEAAQWSKDLRSEFDMFTEVLEDGRR